MWEKEDKTDKHTNTHTLPGEDRSWTNLDTINTLTVHAWETGYWFWNKQVHDFTTSTLRTKQRKGLRAEKMRTLWNVLLQGKVDWSSCGHLNGQRRRGRSTKQTKKRLLCRRNGFWCQDHLHGMCWRTLSLNAPLHSFQLARIGQRIRRNGAVSLAGSVFFFFSFSAGPEGGGNEVLRRRRRTEISKWCLLFVIFSTHACPFQSSLLSPLYLNHTSNNDWGERKKSEAALWGTPTPLSPGHVFVFELFV